MDKDKDDLPSNVRKLFNNDNAKDVPDIARKKYKVLTDNEIAIIDSIKEMGNNFMMGVDILSVNYPSSRREFAIAKTKMEETVMWSVKGITG